MNCLRSLTTGLVLALPAAAQDQATTLLALLRGADVVVVAEVTGASDPSPDWHRREFVTRSVVKGPAPQSFAVLEPAGACCGRSLFALSVGESRLLFLRRQGSTWHPRGGARGVAPATAELLAHVVALRDAADDRAVARILAAGLADAEARIADDAAAALAVLPRLQLDGSGRAAVVAAMQQALLLGSTRLAPLGDVAARCGDDTSVDALLTAYLDAPRDDQATLLRATLGRAPAATVTGRLPAVLDDHRTVRAAELLFAMPGHEARAALRGLLGPGCHPRVQLCVTEALLASGARAAELATTVPAPVLRLAAERARSPRRFRAIDPETR